MTQFEKTLRDAENGDAAAQFELGDLYNWGDGVERNITKAIYWYKKSADQGYAQAQYNLGVAYGNGDGVEKDLKKSFQYFYASANKGYVFAQFNLYIMYKNGTGVDEDNDKAIYWLTKAAEGGLAVAQRNLGIYYEVVKNDELAQQQYKRSKEMGLITSYETIKNTICLFNEEGRANLLKAVEWYEKAAKQGDVSSQYLLGRALYANQTLSDDKESVVSLAKYWLEKAADSGDDEARELLRKINS